MNVKSILLLGASLISFIANGIPLQLVQEAEKADDSMSILLGKFSEQDLDKLKKRLKMAKEDLEKYSKKSVSEDVWDHIARLNMNLLFLEECNDILLKRNVSKKDEIIEKWCDKSYRYEVYLSQF